MFCISAMIDSIGGARKVNNFLTTLNMKPIPHANLTSMERRTGPTVERVAKDVCREAAEATFQEEMRYSFCSFVENLLIHDVFFFNQKGHSIAGSR